MENSARIAKVSLPTEVTFLSTLFLNLCQLFLYAAREPNPNHFPCKFCARPPWINQMYTLWRYFLEICLNTFGSFRKIGKMINQFQQETPSATTSSVLKKICKIRYKGNFYQMCNSDKVEKLLLLSIFVFKTHPFSFHDEASGRGKNVFDVKLSYLRSNILLDISSVVSPLYQYWQN